MTNYNKRPTSTKVIRFQDCDPYGHLNNAKYIDYLINAREDHLINVYDLNVFAMAQFEKRGWLVGHNEIVYLKPANIMEEVMIHTSLIDFTERYVKAEMVMTDKSESHVKALLWTKFYHFDFKVNQGVQHSDDMLSFLEQIKLDIEHENAEQRARFLARSLKEAAVVQ